MESQKRISSKAFFAAVVLLQGVLFQSACSKYLRAADQNHSSSTNLTSNSNRDSSDLQFCYDPDLSKVIDTAEIMLCDGSVAVGQLSLAHLTPENIRAGVDIAGVVGSYVGEPPNPWDIRFGIEVNGASGLLKTACRDMADLTTFDYTSAPAGTGLDIFDTIDDWNNSKNIPTENPFGSEAFLCGHTRVEAAEASSNWLKIEQGSDVIWRDLISGIELSPVRPGTYTWQQAVEACASLNHAGLDSWRFITAREFLTVVRNGLWDLNDEASIGDLSTDVYYFWTATTGGFNTSLKWAGHTDAGGQLTALDNTEEQKAICVRDQN